MTESVLEKKQRQSVRLEPDLWHAIDESCAKRAGNVSRNTWIAEAILDKLAQEHANADDTRDRNA